MSNTLLHTTAARSDRRILSDAGTFLGASWIAQAIGTIRSFAVARILSPDRFGLLQLALLVFEYARSSHGGLLFGMTKEASRAVGSGDESRLHRSKDVAFTGALVLGALALVGVPLFAWLRPDASIEARVAVGAGIFAALVHQVHTFYVALLRAQRRVGDASLTIVVFHASYALLAIVAAWRFGVTGVYFALVASYAAVSLLAWRRSRWRFKFSFDIGTTRGLLRRGVPVLVVTFLFRLISSIDKILVTHLFGLTGLGLYGLAKRAGGIAGGAAESVRWVTLPTFLEDVGRGSDPALHRARLLTIVGGMSFLLPPALATAALLCHLPLVWFLPEYVAAANPARVILLGAGFLSLAGVPRSLLVALDREPKLVAAQLATILGTVALVLFVAGRGGGLVGTAVATVAVQGLYAATVLALALDATGLGALETSKQVLRLLAPQIAVIWAVVAVGIHSSGSAASQPFLPWNWSWPQGVSGTVSAVLLVWIASLAIGAYCGSSRPLTGALRERSRGDRAEGPTRRTNDSVVGGPVA